MNSEKTNSEKNLLKEGENELRETEKNKIR